MKLHTFEKGVHPEEFKHFAETKPLEAAPIPEEVFVPLTQHIGPPCKPLVSKKETVKLGQLIAESSGFISSRIHAPISGTVKTIDTFPHPNGGSSLMIHIIGDGNNEWIETEPMDTPWSELPKETLIQKIEDAGIVGLGGAAFPSHVKLKPPKEKKISALVINGCECEPYLTADHRMMVEQADDMILGVKILMKALDVENAYIGIENNKPDAIEAIKLANRDERHIHTVPLKVKYPQGAEKMLIKAALNKEVPTGGLPMDVGVVVNNVGTAIAVAEAVARNKPLVERVVTITGDGIKEPKNVIARIGTPFKNLLEFCGGLEQDTAKVIMGGPMMGVTQFSLNVPVIKATSGILCLRKQSVPKVEEYPCIVCGACVDVCPMKLLPTRIAKAADYQKFDMAEDLGAMNCIECGSCAFACPSNIPLVQKIRLGKLKINEARRKKA